MIPLKKLPVVVLALGALCGQAQSDTTQRIVDGRENSPEQQSKPYVIMISADGFRYDYTTTYHASNLSKAGTAGVVAEAMIPSFPSLTFPNHYTLVTGLYPSHHGLVDNTFFDRNTQTVYSTNDRKKVQSEEWYGGTPLWVLAETNKMMTASFYWVGSEAPVKNIFPSYRYSYSDLIPMRKRLDAVKKWLTLPKEVRPHLITFYFPQVDHEGHYFGPDSRETAAAVKLVDESVGKLIAMTDSLALPVNFIFVSDHGMTLSDTTSAIKLPSVLNDTSVCRWTGGATMVMVYVKDRTEKQKLYELIRSNADKRYDVYLSEKTPSSWHFRKQDDVYNRIGDIILTSRHPAIFQIGRSKPYPGKHGYDPKLVKHMLATFIAWGPQIKPGRHIGKFENVNVYPLVARILGLPYSEHIDGDPKVLAAILK